MLSKTYLDALMDADGVQLDLLWRHPQYVLRMENYKRYAVLWTMDQSVLDGEKKEGRSRKQLVLFSRQP